MNGRLGTVCQYLPEAGRFEVSISPGQLVKLKEQNLEKLDLKPGDYVQVSGLTSESGKDLNGRSGSVIRLVEEKSRFEVRLGPYWLVSLKAENLQKLERLSLEQETFRSMLRDLLQAYRSCPEIQADASKPLSELRAPTSVIERVGKEKYLAALRGAQAPVFERYSYPGGSKGADLLKAEISRAILQGDRDVAELSRELDYTLGILPPGEGRGDGGDAAQVTRTRLFARSKAVAYREIGQLLARQWQEALTKGKSQQQANDEVLLAEDEREKLSAAAAVRIYEESWRNLLAVQPALLGAEPSTWHHDWGRRVCSAEVVETLVKRGFVVLPRALDSSLASRAGQELSSKLHEKRRLRRSTAPLNCGALSTWLQIAEEEDKAHVRLCFPALYEAAEKMCSLPDALLAADGSGCFSKLRTDPTVKVSAHEPGVKHGLHLDSFGGETNLRMVTCLLYVNDEDFTEQHGGALRIFEELMPPDVPRNAEVPEKGAEEPHLDVPPLTGTLVLFLSRRVCHEVLPASRNRYLMTLWVPALP